MAMTEEHAKQAELEELCRRIEALASADHLTEEQKLSFVREALEIMDGKYKEGEVQ